MLSDNGNAIAKSYGLEFILAEHSRPLYLRSGIGLVGRKSNAQWRLTVPATFVVAPKRKIGWRFVEPDDRKRAEAGDRIAAHNAMAR